MRSREILIPFRLWNPFSFGDNISYSVISHSAQILRNCVECTPSPVVRRDARLASTSHRASPDSRPGRRAHADAVNTRKTGTTCRSNRDHQGLLLRCGRKRHGVCRGHNSENKASGGEFKHGFLPRRVWVSYNEAHVTLRAVARSHPFGVPAATPSLFGT